MTNHSCGVCGDDRVAMDCGIRWCRGCGAVSWYGNGGQWTAPESHGVVYRLARRVLDLNDDARVQEILDLCVMVLAAPWRVWVEATDD